MTILSAMPGGAKQIPLASDPPSLSYIVPVSNSRDISLSTDPEILDLAQGRSFAAPYGDLNPTLSITINGILRVFGQGRVLHLRLANGRSIWVGTCHQLSYAMCFAEFGENSRSVRSGGGLPWIHVDAHSDALTGYGSRDPTLPPFNLADDWSKAATWASTTLDPRTWLVAALRDGLVARLTQVLGIRQGERPLHIEPIQTTKPRIITDLVSVTYLEPSILDIDLDLFAKPSPSSLSGDWPASRDRLLRLAEACPVIMLCTSSETIVQSGEARYLEPGLALGMLGELLTGLEGLPKVAGQWSDTGP